MLCLKDGLFTKASVWQHIVVLLLTHCCGGQSQVVGPPPPIVALVGDDILLPCHLDPEADAVSMTLEWGRPDLKPRFVHVWHEGQNLLVNQNPSYKARTSLSIDKLKHGDLSLKLSTVKVSDSGTYRCFIPKQNRESTVQLIVGSVSSPVVTGINISNNVRVLNCESKGWYPQPEVFWLDGEGNQLSAGPTETVRGPDGLYTVSSRVTVEKRHSNSFTCRVHQKNINQTRETHIQISGFIISDEGSVVCSGSAARISIILAAVFICALAVAFIVWKWQQNKTETKTYPVDETELSGQREQLMENSRNKEDPEEKRVKLDEQIQKKEEEKKEVVLSVNTLKELMEKLKELKELKDQLSGQKVAMVREINDLEKQVESTDKETEHDRAKGYYKLRTIVIQNKKKMRQIKEEQDKLVTITQELMTSADRVLLEIKTEVKQQVENLCDKATGC